MPKLPITLEDAYTFLGIDIPDEHTAANVSAAIEAADAWLMGAIGADYPRDDPRARQLAKALVQDLYDNRGVESTQSGMMRQMFMDYQLQLRMELRRSGGGA